MSFDFLNNVFLLNFSLEAAKGVFESLALLKLYFRQFKTPPNPTENFLHFAEKVLIS